MTLTGLAAKPLAVAASLLVVAVSLLAVAASLLVVVGTSPPVVASSLIAVVVTASSLIAVVAAVAAILVAAPLFLQLCRESCGRLQNKLPRSKWLVLFWNVGLGGAEHGDVTEISFVPDS